jgi:hypothetical protein
MQPLAPSPTRTSGPARPQARAIALWLSLAGLVLVQQDYAGWWDAPVIVLGFVPRPLAVQVGVSLAAAAVWWWATRWCWPADLEPQDDSAGPGGGGA